MKSLPTISIVVPNFNSGKTIARTLQSLIDQDYPGLEIIVMDGGSTDNSVEIIKSFQERITSWVSEKDRGQSDAINRGFAKCTGEIVNWLCADDSLTAGALHTVGSYFAANPQIDIAAGACRYRYLYKGYDSICRPSAETYKLMPIINSMGQSAVFYRREIILDRPGPLREELHYTMDLELWCHFSKAGRRWGFIEEILSEAVEDGNNKTAAGGLKIVTESERVYREYCGEPIPLPFWYKHLQYPMARYMNGNSPVLLRSIARQARRGLTVLLAPFYGIERIRTMECWGQYFEAEERK
jgi:glycosyltransferase involved in cell wall biosynthesis